MKTPEQRLQPIREASDPYIPYEAEQAILRELREAVAEEREACAKSCDEILMDAQRSPFMQDNMLESGARLCAERIRLNVKRGALSPPPPAAPSMEKKLDAAINRVTELEVWRETIDDRNARLRAAMEPNTQRPL